MTQKTLLVSQLSSDEPLLKIAYMYMYIYVINYLILIEMIVR